VDKIPRIACERFSSMNFNNLAPIQMRAFKLTPALGCSDDECNSEIPAAYSNEGYTTVFFPVVMLDLNADMLR
jgi:hypothetical protein